jgi:WD40 repeat protein
VDQTVRLWDVSRVVCLRIFEGHAGPVSSVAWSPDGCLALSGSSDHTLRLWELDWELEPKQPSDWAEGARPYLATFLAAHTPYRGTFPVNRQPTEEEITLALTRHGKPTWTNQDFEHLRDTLRRAGFGWLRPEGVRRELEKMAATWQGPPPLS